MQGQHKLVKIDEKKSALFLNSECGSSQSFQSQAFGSKYHKNIY